MLVWLSSYPRSGNTLLRQVLKTCFDLDSCEGLEPVAESLRDRDDFRQRYYGNYFLDSNEEEFYQNARLSPELVLMKTHQLPRDDAKAIYVVRDGRLALKSFVKYQNTYNPGSSSFESLLLGDHPYGDWTNHYRAWCERRVGPLLLLRFEELTNPGAEVLARLAEFLGVGGPVRPWVNQIDALREHSPEFFGAGDTAWRPGSFWTDTRLRQFYTLHGELLTQLGYATAAEVTAGAYPAGSDEEQLLRFSHQLVKRKDGLQAVCDERLEEINQLARACEERLAEITRQRVAFEQALAHQTREREALPRRAQHPTRGGLLRRIQRLTQFNFLNLLIRR